nr:pectin acetylesterase 8-like [Ipomoea batatas]
MAILTRSNQWICLLVFSLVILVHSIRTDASVPTFILKSAVDEGAGSFILFNFYTFVVCLDGSPPAYNWDAGKGEGARNWLLHLQGGGWCLNSTLYQTFDYSVEHCANRVNGFLGSSLHMPAAENLTGVLSEKPDKALPAECTSKMSPFECFFPKSLVQYVKSPMYFLNSAFDSFQKIRNTFSEDLHDAIKNHTVSPSDVPMLKDFRQQLLSVLPPSSDKGFVITSLFGHTFSLTGLKKPMFVDKKSEVTICFYVTWENGQIHF